MIHNRDNEHNAQNASPLNILVLYEDRSTHIGTIKEHLQAFKLYSRHRCQFLPATGFLPDLDDRDAASALAVYDAIVVHYSVRLSINSHLSARLAKRIAEYGGLKLLFIQDEYDTTETARQWIERLGIDTVFTNVPPDQVELVYPKARFANVQFLQTLTGYVPEDPSLDGFSVPMANRILRIGYRGRRLPHQYGRLGYEKYLIGLEIKKLAERQGIPIDIEVDDSRRIYGLDWYRFMGSCRTTLGTESGSNVFDDDGSLADLATRHKDLSFEDFEAQFLSAREGLVRMNQISPKIFEAIRLRTALILFEGRYSGVVEADRHFIPLKKDFSNISEVFEKLDNFNYLEGLTQRAYDDIIASGKYSYAAFVRNFDAVLTERCPDGPRMNLSFAPSYARCVKTSQIYKVPVATALLCDSIFGREELSRENVLKADCVPTSSLGPAGGRRVGRASLVDIVQRIGHLDIVRRAWHVLPVKFQAGVLRQLKKLS